MNYLGSGSIEFPEFMQLMAKRMKETDIEREIKEAFQAFDDERKGFLTSENLRRIMLNFGDKDSLLNEDEIDEMIKYADIDGDGDIDYNGGYMLVTSWFYVVILCH